MSDHRQQKKREIVETYYNEYLKDVMKTYYESMLPFKPLPLIMDDIKFYKKEFRERAISTEELLDHPTPLDAMSITTDEFDDYMTNAIKTQMQRITERMK